MTITCPEPGCTWKYTHGDAERAMNIADDHAAACHPDVVVEFDLEENS